VTNLPRLSERRYPPGTATALYVPTGGLAETQKGKRPIVSLYLSRPLAYAARVRNKGCLLSTLAYTFRQGVAGHQHV